MGDPPNWNINKYFKIYRVLGLDNWRDLFAIYLKIESHKMLIWFDIFSKFISIS